jgi:glycosyltransferase involved in cell wall biosynthesis
VRVAFVVHTFFPNWRAGTEIYTRSLARKVIENGHQAFVVCYEPPEEGDSFSGIRASDEICEGLPIHRISFCKQPHFFHLREYFRPEVEDHLMHYFSEVQPDVVHVTHAMHLSTASIWAAKKLGFPVVSTATDFWYVCPTFQLVKWDESLCSGPHPLTCLACVTGGLTGSWLRRVARRKWLARALSPVLVLLGRLPFVRSEWLADLVSLSQRPHWMKTTLSQIDVLLAPTANTARLLTINGMKPSEMRTSGFGIEPHAFLAAPRRPHSSVLRVGYIGTFRRSKGLHILLEAIRQLPADKVQLDAYGSPGHFPGYDREISRLAEGCDNVTFRGTFPNERLHEIFADIDVLAIPSLWYENSPLVLLSAFASKTPVVASNVGSLADLVEHGKSGLLFEMGDPIDLASQLRKLIEDPGLAGRLRAGIPGVKTIDENIGELLDIYARLKRESGPGPERR